MVEIHIQISLGFNPEADAAVLGEMVQHVVEKSDACIDRALGFSIQDHPSGDVGFLGFAG